MSLFDLHHRPDLESPVLIQVLDGWIDAGMAAAAALQAILGHTEAETIVTFDNDNLLDHRARRPTMHLVDGINTGLTWPSIEIQAASDLVGNDVLLLIGAEPDHQWQAFSRAVVDLAHELGARMVVGLGAYPAAVPHTRPTQLACTATTSTLVERVGFVRGTIEVPAGAQAAVERRCAEVGLPAIGLWAQVPHYASTMPYPAAGAALLDGLAEVAGLRFDAEGLEEDAGAMTRRLSELVSQNPDHEEMVSQLEDAVDALGGQPGSMPTGDELAEELQRFLREQGD